MDFEGEKPEWAFGDLSDVKEERSILPPTKGLKVRVAKASINSTKDKSLAGLGLDLVIVDGIESVDTETGETEYRYKNKHLFTNGSLELCFFADTEVKVSDWFKTKQHLVEFKKFLTALDIPLAGASITDQFLSELVGREILVDVQQEKDQVKNPETGDYVDTGTFRNRLRNWKKAA